VSTPLCQSYHFISIFVLSGSAEVQPNNGEWGLSEMVALSIFTTHSLLGKLWGSLRGQSPTHKTKIPFPFVGIYTQLSVLFFTWGSAPNPEVF